jgi:hypothetical protein
MNFTITENEGVKYSKISGDYNKIHIDEKTGYNSIFGEKINNLRKLHENGEWYKVKECLSCDIPFIEIHKIKNKN